MKNDEWLMRPVDVARELDMNPQRLYRAIRAGKIKTGGPNGRYVSLEDVRAYLAQYGRWGGYKEYKKSA